jgi:hypothetical protein
MSADGKWSITVNSPMGAQKSDVLVKTAGDAFTGTVTSPQGTQEISGKVDGDTLTWSLSITTPMPLTLEFTAKVAGDDMTGTAKAGAFGSFPLTGKRAA